MINKKTITIFVVVVVAIAAIITIISAQSKPLPAYTGENVINSEATEETTVAPIETFTYTDGNIGLSLAIPDGWQNVVKDGYQTFIHSPSASSIQVRIDDYDPRVNLTNETDLSVSLTAEGYTITDFYWADNSSYMLVYQSNDDRPVDCIEITTFDRDHIATVIYTVYDDNYNKLKDILAYSVDSIKWDKQNPIPATLQLAYNEFGSFEYPVPMYWNSGYTEGAFYASDPETGASYTITVTESDAQYSAATELEYVSFASAGRNNFLLKSFASDTEHVNATAQYYSADGVQMMLRQYMVATGEYEYCITEECPAETYEYAAEILDQIIGMFRIF